MRSQATGNRLVLLQLRNIRGYCVIMGENSGILRNIGVYCVIMGKKEFGEVASDGQPFSFIAIA